ERIRKEEQIEYENLIQYSDFSGRDKRIAMLSDIANKLMEEAAKADKLSTTVMSIGQEKERDWATWGGIANGLGGVGAGVSTAIDIQNKNMQIRANNKARRHDHFRHRAVIGRFYSLFGAVFGKCRKRLY
ncbi:MAG: hypothetical protein IIY02_05000, partial [Firmicutes bacterium]|nr:hypothetical protein [Bacillota bacterium]